MQYPGARRQTTAFIAAGAVLGLAATGYLMIRAWHRFFQKFTFDERFGLVRIHHVSPDNVLTPHPGEAGQRAWEQFQAIATAGYANGRVVEYHIADRVDGRNFAETSTAHDDNDRWKLIVNIAVAGEQDFIHTLVHEYAHLISLDSSQLNDDSSACHTVRCEGGCAREGSFIWAFHTAFWERYGAAAPPPDNNDHDMSNPFYDAHADDFVSDYAATNVIEDFAESFMTFVLTDAPTGDTLADDKVRFFWDRPEERDRRQRIRSVLGLL